jgi:hypothetical protein
MIYIIILILLFLLLVKPTIFEGFTDQLTGGNIFNYFITTNNPIHGFENKIVNDVVYNDEQELNCHLISCNDNRTATYAMYFIGNDELNNPLFNLNNDYFTITNSSLIKILPDIKKIKKNNYKLMVPISLTDDNIKLNIKLKYREYDLYGYLTNNNYNVKYLLYGKKLNTTSIENADLYEYIVVNIFNNEYYIKYILPPRQIINLEETIWIEENRTLRLGPFLFTNKF